MIKIYTDGAASLPSRQAGYGAVIIHENETYPISGHIDNGTNQIAEIFACIVGLQTTLKNFAEVLKTDRAIEIYSDSAYVVNAINQKWIENWKRNGWKTAAKTAVKNKPLWEELDKLLGFADVTFHKVAGHQGNKYNEMADKLAVFGKTNKGNNPYVVTWEE